MNEKASLSKLQNRVVVQNTLRAAALRHGLSIVTIEQHLWGENGVLDDKASLDFGFRLSPKQITGFFSYRLAIRISYGKEETQEKLPTDGSGPTGLLVRLLGWIPASPSVENSEVLRAIKVQMNETLPEAFLDVHGSGHFAFCILDFLHVG